MGEPGRRLVGPAMNADELAYQEVMTMHKGAGVAILVTFLRFRRPMGVQELCDLCGYKHPSVEAALRKLAQRGYVQRVGYHGGWMLTAIGFQLSFLVGQTVALAENLQVVGVGLNSLSLNNKTLSIPTPTPLEDNLQVESNITRPLAQSLVDLGRVQPEVALLAVEDAMGRQGIAPCELADRIAGFATYIHSPDGKGLRAPGAWAAGQIAAGWQAPSEIEGDPLARFDGFITEANNES